MTERADAKRTIQRVHRRLARLRWAIRGYLVVYGLAMVALVAVVCFWASLAIDWYVEPPVSVRYFIGAGLVLVALIAIVRFLILRLMVPLRSRHLALILERDNPRFADGLITTVELADRSAEESGYDPAMLSDTARQAGARLRRSSTFGTLNFRPLWISLAFGVVGAATVVIFGFMKPELLETWRQRVVGMQDVVWPRESRIEVDGFPVHPETGRRTEFVVRGETLKVQVRADTEMKIPQSIELHFQSEDGRRGYKNVLPSKPHAVSGRDRFQNFDEQFSAVQATLRVEAIAKGEGTFQKEDRVEDLWIQVVERPSLSFTVECQYPNHLGLPPASVQTYEYLKVPEGTVVTIKANSSKDLSSVRWSRSDLDQGERKINLAADAKQFDLPLGPLSGNTAVSFDIKDREGISSLGPIALQFDIVENETPKVSATLEAIQGAITPRALLPFSVELRDSHGLVRGQLALIINRHRQRSLSLAMATIVDVVPGQGLFSGLVRSCLAASRRKIRSLPIESPVATFAEFEAAIDMIKESLLPGDRVAIEVWAEDRYWDSAIRHVGRANVASLEVVTDGELKTRLDRQEQALRRRFTKLVDDLAGSRDSLARIIVELDRRKALAEDAARAKEEAEKAKEKSPGAGENGDIGDVGETAKPSAEAEPSRSAEVDNPTKDSDEKKTDEKEEIDLLSIVRVEDAKVTSDRVSEQLGEVSRAFETILRVYEINRAESLSDHKKRIDGRIVTPLNRIIQDQFLVLNHELADLRDALGDDKKTRGQVKLLTKQLDTMIAQLNEIGTQMAAGEGYAEVLARFREIILLHEEIVRDAKRRRAELKRKTLGGALEEPEKKTP